MPSKHVSPEEQARKKALNRAIKKMTGGFIFGRPKCAACGKEFSEDELLAEDLIWSVGHGMAVLYHNECFKQTYGMGGR